jgi:parallel beta-helix repeat protein
LLKRIVPGIMLTLLLVGVLTLAFSIQPVRADGTVYIRADGSIDPPTSPIRRNGNLYTLIGNMDVAGDGIVIERNNMTLDGAGYTVCDWSGAMYTKGIYLDGTNNVTVESVNVKQFWCGIWLGYSSSRNTILLNNITAIHDKAIYLNRSSCNIIAGNSIANDGVGITLQDSSNNSIKENRITAISSFGVDFEGNSVHNSVFRNEVSNITYCWGIWDASNYNVISENNMTGIGHYGYGYYSILVSGTNNTIIGNNVTANDNGIIVGGVNNTVVGNNVTANSHVGISPDEGVNNTILGNDVTYNEHGIMVIYSSNNTFRNNRMAYNKYNFGVAGSGLPDFAHDIDTSNTVDNKSICYWVNKRDMTVPSDCGYVGLVNCTNIAVQSLKLNNNSQGILLFSTMSSSITKTGVTNNECGIWLNASSQNHISENNITNNSGNGIHLDESPDNDVSKNNITSNNGAGIQLNTYGVDVYGNSVSYNGYGIRVSNSNNKIYHNNFINNDNPAFVTPHSPNVWDSGFPSGGNYWSGHSRVDVKRGPGQDQPGSDGIGDTPYIINGNNRDNYPLMKPYPWATHDIGITSVTTSKIIVGQDYNVSISIMVFNYGNDTENINITIYANSTIIGEIRNVSLSKKDFTISSFTWNTSGFAKGNYTIWAYAWPVLGETDTADNTLVYGTVKVTILGDVDGNFLVDIYDITAICVCYDSKIGQPLYNPNCDLDGNGIIDIFDVTAACVHYGQKYP